MFARRSILNVSSIVHQRWNHGAGNDHEQHSSIDAGTPRPGLIAESIVRQCWHHEAGGAGTMRLGLTASCSSLFNTSAASDGVAPPGALPSWPAALSASCQSSSFRHCLMLSPSWPAGPVPFANIQMLFLQAAFAHLVQPVLFHGCWHHDFGTVRPDLTPGCVHSWILAPRGRNSTQAAFV